MTEREKLAVKLMEVYWYEDMTDNPAGVTTHALRLADWVLADRKRIVGPLVKHLKGPIDDNAMCEAIDKTLRLAGAG